MSWTIQVAGGGVNQFDTVNISDARRSLKHAGIDKFTFKQLAEVTDTPICVYGQAVIIKNGDTIWFQGVCTFSEPEARGAIEIWNIEISGGWYWLDITVFLQPWAQISGGPYNSGRIVMGYKVLDEALVYASIGDVIAEVMGYITSNPGPNVPLQLGTLDISTFSYPQEFLDVTCGELIRRLLKYCPDVVSWVDYTTTPPTVNFQSRYTLESCSKALTDFGDKGFTCKPRPDLIPPQIVIVYEVTNTADGIPGVSVLYDAVPGGSTGNVPRALVMTIPLHGVNETYAKQWLRVQAIPTNFDSPDNALCRFYKMFVPDFKLADTIEGDTFTPDITFYPLDPFDPDTYFKQELAQPDGIDGDGNPFVYADPTDTGSTMLYLDDTLTNALLEGNIMPWMLETNGQVQTITFRASWTVNGVQCGLDPITGAPGIKCHATMTATNGLSQTYHDLQQYESGEGAPTGLAAALTASLAGLQYEGSATLVETEVSGSMPLGKVLNVTSGRAEWETMDALLQTLDEDIDKGITTVKFGPAAHLNIQDMIELLRMGRPAGDWDTRAAGASARPQLTGLL
jgi:hypothetical protein